MLKIKNLSKSFFANKILDDITLSIVPGKLTTLLGENGSGKSTLLNILSGFELPDSGEVTYCDEPLDKMNFSHVHDIFFVHENINYILSLNMDEYIHLLKKEIPKWDDEFFNKMVKDRKINLKNNYQNFSRGQKMQIALMIGLASNASILLLDEITSVIDVYGRKYFLDLLGQYVKSGKTVVMTTNIINELEFYTDNLIVIKNSKIALDRPISEIPEQFVKIRRNDSNNHPIFDHKDCVWAGVNSDKSVSYIIPADLLSREKVPEEMLDRRKSSLEDVFIYYFNKNEEENENAA
jgi:ABC-2 type transport system ATP-binding protein